MNNYKLGSLFDGSGGFPLAGALCGIEPVWASEVEPYPIAVTRSRFPMMKHLGDISKVNGAEIEPVDIITFGSPCQDLSVAGKQTGIKHTANGDEETTRSGLFMEAVRIIKEMRRATNGQYPRFAIWENVPGAFSSNKGEDFRIVCEELIKIVEPSAFMPPVPKNGWNYADSYIGDGWSLAYRVFDAQYWGVPQRRRRIHLVADFRGECAREVLFEREGLRGYFAQGRTPWQTTPTDAQGSTGADDREGEGLGGDRGRRLDAVGADLFNASLSGDRAATLDTHCGLPNGPAGVVYSFDSLASNSMKSSNPHSGCREVEVAKTLDTTDPNPSKNQGGIAIVQPVFCEAYQHHGWRESEKAGTLTAAQNDHVRGDTPLICETVYCLQGNGIDRADTAGCNGKGVKEDISYTLNTIDRPAVAFLASGEETVDTLCAGSAMRQFSGNQEIMKGSFHVIEPHPRHYIVRRLTPTECARLQGFADWWGVVEQKDTLTEEEFRFWLEVRNTHARINGKKVQEYTERQMLTWYNKLYTDSAEYKMWGNGISLPTALYVLQGVAEALNTEEEDAWML